MSAEEGELRDVYARVTQVIVEAIERGRATYQMPWHADSGDGLLPVNVQSSAPYRGVNVVALWAIARKCHFESGLWGTYRQWAEVGAQVRRGERGSTVVFWKRRDAGPGEEEENGEKGDSARRLVLARGYTVFNVAQVDGYARAIASGLSPQERDARAEEFLFGLGADIRHGYDRAAYDPQSDQIVMPSFERFRSGVAYLSTLSHEVTHWSGAKQRLARDLQGRFGSTSYAMEELVAELGSAFLSARLEITTEPRTDHAGYVESWLSVLKKDQRAIFTAAAKAQQAVDWLELTHAARQHDRQTRTQGLAIAWGKATEPDSGPEMGP